jgi:hypothetical protein
VTVPLRRIAQLSRKTGESPADIIKKGVELYDRYFVSEDLNDVDADTKLAEVVGDPDARKIFRQFMSQLGKHSQACKSPEERREQASAGGTARRDSLTAAQRKKQARAAVEVRWAKARAKTEPQCDK